MSVWRRRRVALVISGSGADTKLIDGIIFKSGYVGYADFVRRKINYEETFTKIIFSDYLDFWIVDPISSC